MRCQKTFLHHCIYLFLYLEVKAEYVYEYYVAIKVHISTCFLFQSYILLEFLNVSQQDNFFFFFLF